MMLLIIYFRGMKKIVSINEATDKVLFLMLFTVVLTIHISGVIIIVSPDLSHIVKVL